MSDIDSTRSSFRESLIEHAFISAVLQEAWRRQMVIEVLRPEVDAGVDVVFECGTVVRHVQLKSRRAGAKVARYNVNTSLETKQSGAVVLIEFEDHEGDMRLQYRFFGRAPGKSLSLNGFNAAKHSKGNALDLGWCQQVNSGGSATSAHWSTCFSVDGNPSTDWERING